MNELSVLNGQLIMTSLEVSNLTGKRHSDVLRDISNMFKDLGNERKNALVEYTDKKGEKRPMYQLDKSEALCLVSGYEAKLRMLIIKRWDELENSQKPKTALEIIQAQTQVLIEQEKRIAANEEAIKKITAKQTAFEEGLSYFTVLGYGVYKGITIDLSFAQKVGKEASNLSKERGVPVDKARDVRFGMINSYHEKILDEVVSGML